MDPKDNYFARFGDLTNASKKWDKLERFGEVNDKTLGVLVVRLLVYVSFFLPLYFHCHLLLTFRKKSYFGV